MANLVPSSARVLLLAGALLIGSAPALGDTRIGVNAMIRNSVQEKLANEASLHQAQLRAPVHLGDSIVSGDQSTLQVLLLDQSVLTVGANARVTLDRFVYDPDRSASDVAASVVTGAFRFMSGRSLSGFGHNAISTPAAVIGVRGTVLEGAVGNGALLALGKQGGLPPFSGDPAGVTLVVLRGPGSGTQGFDRPGAIDVTSGGVTVDIHHPGQAAVVFGPGKPPFGPFDLSDAAFDELNLLLRATPGSGPDDSDLDTASAGKDSGDNLDVGPLGGDPYNQKTGTIDFPLPFIQDVKGGGGG